MLHTWGVQGGLAVSRLLLGLLRDSESEFPNVVAVPTSHNRNGVLDCSLDCRASGVLAEGPGTSLEGSVLALLF